MYNKQSNKNLFLLPITLFPLQSIINVLLQSLPHLEGLTSFCFLCLLDIKSLSIILSYYNYWDKTGDYQSCFPDIFLNAHCLSQQNVTYLGVNISVLFIAISSEPKQYLAHNRRFTDIGKITNG